MPEGFAVVFSAEFLDQLAEAVAQRVADKLRGSEINGLIDQSASALGPRRHCALARQLLRAGDRRAGHIGRRWLLTPEAIDEALGRGASRAEPHDSLLDELNLEKAS